MADLPELNEWVPGIYQLETSDPVLGGPEGIDNKQAKQLASRTKWLKDQIDKIIAGTITVAKTAKLAVARTISITGAGSGSAAFDGSANVNIALTLADSGVAPGTYTKVAINVKGLVTVGGFLVAADIPSLDWTKIGSGKPTTLGGYGITDALKLSGGDLTGNLRMVGSRSVDVMASDSSSWAGGVHARAISGTNVLGGFGAWGNGDTLNCLYMGLSSVPWEFGYGVRVSSTGVSISGPLTANGSGVTGVPWGGLTGTPTTLAG